MCHQELVPREPLPEVAKLSNHHVRTFTDTACSVQLSVPPLSKAHLLNPFASLKCNHRLPPQNINTSIGVPRAREPLLDSPAAILPCHTHTTLEEKDKGEAEIQIKGLSRG